MEELKIAQDLIEVLEYLGEKFGIALNWGSADLVPYLKELGGKIVAYKSGIAWLWLSVAAIILLISIVLLIISLRKEDWGLFFVAACFLFLGAVIAIFNGYTLIACNTFPEKVILDYIRTIQQSTGR